jgi:hypothetical protein
MRKNSTKQGKRDSLCWFRYNFSLRKIYFEIFFFFWNELHHAWPVILLKTRARRDLAEKTSKFGLDEWFLNRK